MPTEIASEAHDNDICKIGNTRPASLHASHLKAGFTRYFKAERFVLHQILLLKGLNKVKFVSNDLCFSLLL